QVDSDDLTIAINFWWKSRIMTEMLEHMDAYYLRRILRSEDWWIQRWDKIAQKNSFSHAQENNGFQPTDKALRRSEQFNLHNEVKSHDTSDKKGATDTSDKKVLKRLTKIT
uniref:Uncharacterized protein n=1 Tax=Aegilops tauschii subsp. strangulata TaxID=200361 RepID=A0A453FMM8_AEGTS